MLCCAGQSNQEERFSGAGEDREGRLRPETYKETHTCKQTQKPENTRDEKQTLSQSKPANFRFHSGLDPRDQLDKAKPE